MRRQERGQPRLTLPHWVILGSRGLGSTMENQMEKKTGNEMEAGIIGLTGGILGFY